MPTYEYSCKKCGEQIEVFQSFSAKPLTKHAGCGGELKKVFHPRGVVFKGSGFYKTDSKKSSSGSSESVKRDTSSKKETASKKEPSSSTSSSDSSGSGD